MTGILVPSRRIWTSQPQRAPEIDVPDGAALIFALVGSQGMRNLAGVQPTITGTPIVALAGGQPMVRCNTSNRFSAGPKVSNRGRFTVLYVGSLDAPSTSYSCHPFGQVASNTDTASAATYDWSIYESGPANLVTIQASNGSAITSASPADAPTWLAGKTRSVAACIDAGVPKISVDGGAVGIGAALSGGLVAANWGMAAGGYWGNPSYNPQVRIALAVVIDGWAAQPDELRALSANPWGIFRPRRRAVWVDLGAGGGSLPASASGGAVAGGSATAAIQVALAGVGVALAGGSASAGAAVPLSSTGISQSGGGATATATVTISAAGLAQAAGAAGLSAAVLIQAAGAAQAAGNATLAAHLNAMAAGAAQAGGSASLSGGAPGSLSADGAASAAGAAILSIAVSLVASGSAQAGGSANIDGSAPGSLTAVGGAAASGAGTLVATVQLTAAGFVQAMGSGVFVVQVPISALGSATAAGSANLTDLAAVALVKDPRLAVRRQRNFVVAVVSRRRHAH